MTRAVCKSPLGSPTEKNSPRSLTVCVSAGVGSRASRSVHDGIPESRFPRPDRTSNTHWRILKNPGHGLPHCEVGMWEFGRATSRPTIGQNGPIATDGASGRSDGRQNPGSTPTGASDPPPRQSKHCVGPFQSPGKAAMQKRKGIPGGGVSVSMVGQWLPRQPLVRPPAPMARRGTGPL